MAQHKKSLFGLFPSSHVRSWWEGSWKLILMHTYSLLFCHHDHTPAGLVCSFSPGTHPLIEHDSKGTAASLFSLIHLRILASNAHPKAHKTFCKGNYCGATLLAGSPIYQTFFLLAALDISITRTNHSNWLSLLGILSINSQQL